jgi:hypothetical protein
VPTDYNHNGLHSAGEETHRRQQRIFELRRSNVSFPQIAQLIAKEENRPNPYTQGYIYKLYKRGLKQIIFEDVDAVRKMELARLDEMQNYIQQVLGGFQPLVNRGTIVVDYLEDEHGNPVLDEEGNPIPVKLQDVSVKLNAINAAMKIMERRARILGLDAPTKIAATNPAGDKEASLVQYYLPENGRDQPFIDVTPDPEPEEG